MEQRVGSKAFLSESLVRTLVLKSAPKGLNYPPPPLLPLRPHSAGTCLTVSPHTLASGITAASSIIPRTAEAIPSNYRTARLRSPLETPTDCTERRGPRCAASSPLWQPFPSSSPYLDPHALLGETAYLSRREPDTSGLGTRLGRRRN